MDESLESIFHRVSNLIRMWAVYLADVGPFQANCALIRALVETSPQGQGHVEKDVDVARMGIFLHLVFRLFPRFASAQSMHERRQSLEGYPLALWAGWV